MAGTAEQSARPVILEATSESALACPVKSGCHRVAFPHGDKLSVKANVHSALLRAPRTRVRGPHIKGSEHSIGSRISQSLEPLVAPVAVEPPFLLFPGLIHFCVNVPIPRVFTRARLWTRFHLTPKAEFVSTAFSTLRTSQQKRHQAPKTFLVPASGISQIMDASAVNAAMSSGSK